MSAARIPASQPSTCSIALTYPIATSRVRSSLDPCANFHSPPRPRNACKRSVNLLNCCKDANATTLFQNACAIPSLYKCSLRGGWWVTWPRIYNAKVELLTWTELSRFVLLWVAWSLAGSCSRIRYLKISKQVKYGFKYGKKCHPGPCMLETSFV